MKKPIKLLTAIIIIILILLRIILPYGIQYFANQQLHKLSGFNGQVQAVSLSLLKGSMGLEQVQIEKVDAQAIKPAFSADSIMLGLDWADLLKGQLHTKLVVINPKLYFVLKAKAKPAAQEEIAATDIWQQTQKQLLPLKIDEIVLQNAELHYINRLEQPVFDVQINQINADLTGLQALATSDNPLPAHIKMNAQMLGHADTSIELWFNPKASTPTFKLEAKMGPLQLNKANDFLHHYTKLVADQGQFSLYLEAAANNGKIQGYAKPFLQDLKVSLLPEDKQNPIKVIYKSVAQALSNALQNNQTDKAATQIDISGPIDDPDASLWSIIANLLQNAFLQALLPGVDHSVKLPH